MAKVKSYMNPNIPKPKPGDSKAEVTKPVEPRKKRRTPPGITGPAKRERRPLPPGTRYDYGMNAEKRPLPKPINKSGLKKDGPSGKRGSISMSVKKPVLLSLKKTSGR